MVVSAVMTDESAQAGPATVRVPADSARGPWWREPASWAVLVTLVLWAVPLTHAGGGRDRLALTWALLLLVPALLVVRPWRTLGRLDLLALAPAAAALVACLLAPTGFDGLGELASFAYGGVLFVLVRGWLNAGGRVTLVLAALCVAGLDQFAAAWWPWYGRQTSSSLMVGTFYWHNQFAVFMAALGLVGGALLVRGSGRLRWAAAAVVVCSVPALAFAASRATLALYVAAWAVLVAVNARRPRTLVPLLVAPVVGVGLAVLLASPLLMSGSGSVAGNLDQRETVVGNGSARLVYDRVAVDLIGHRPLTGTGFDSFAGASAPLMPTNLQPTLYVHNGYLEAFVDGGVLLGGAVAVAALLPLLVGLRRMRRGRLGLRGDTVDAATLGAGLALGLLAAHSAVDFDWTYPSLVALYAILAALVTRSVPASAVASAVDTPDARRRVPFLPVALVLTLAVALPASVRSAAVAAPSEPLPGWTTVASLGIPLQDVPAWLKGSGECAAQLRGDLGTPSTTEIRRDVDCLGPAAADAPSLAMLRARGLMQLGRTVQAESIAADVVARHGTRMPALIVLQALLPHDGGDDAASRVALESALADPRVAGDPATVEFARSALAALPPARSAS